MVTCLELPAVQDRPALFSTFLMWLLADLFHDLPEVGDVDKPKLVFFFDEAHLLFDDASKAFQDAIEQTVRLIRSKGVGVFFVTQSPKDVPADVLAQLGNRVQHALRAFTPEDAKALKAAVSTYPHSGYDLEELLTSLGTGEAVVTVLSEQGRPHAGRVDPDDRPAVAHGAVRPRGRHRQLVERRVRHRVQVCRGGRPRVGLREAPGPAARRRRRPQEAPAPAPAPRADAPARAPRAPKEEPSVVEQVVKSSAFRSVLRSAGTVIGREITRSIFGTARRRR